VDKVEANRYFTPQNKTFYHPLKQPFWQKLPIYKQKFHAKF